MLARNKSGWIVREYLDISENDIGKYKDVTGSYAIIKTALLRVAEESLHSRGITTAKVNLGKPKEQWIESYSFYPKNGYEEYEPGHMIKKLI